MPVPMDGKENNENSQNTTITEGSENEEKAKGEAPKTFTQEDVNEIVRKRVNEVNAKNEKTIEQKIKEAQTEWERQQKLSEEDRAAEERKKHDAEVAERERALSLRENRVEAHEILKSENIPTSLIDFVVDADMEQTKDNIGKLKVAWNKALEEGIQKATAGTTPADRSSANTNHDGKTSVHDLLFKK